MSDQISRREFLGQSYKRYLKSGIGVLGMFIGNNINDSYMDPECPSEISCRDCFRMGICENVLAQKARFEVKTSGQTAKISKGANHG